MKKTIFIVFVMSLFLVTILSGCGGGGSSQPTPLFEDNFNYSNSTFPTSPWTVAAGDAGGSWSVNTTEHYLQRANSGTFSISLYISGSSWTKYSVSANVKPSSTAAASRQGIIARSSSNGKSYYALLLSGGNLVLRKHSTQINLVPGPPPNNIPIPVEIPVDNDLDSKACTYSTTNFGTLTLEVNGSNITGYFNKGLTDQVMVQSTDTTYSSGTIGIYSEGAAVVFDNVVVMPL